MALPASSHCARHAPYSAGDSRLRATTNVRRPCRENAASATLASWGNGSVTNFSMTLSAPFVITSAPPSGVAHTTLMRFLSEVKPRTCRTSWSCTPHGARTRWMLRPPPDVSRASKATPTDRAASTSATSSGDSPWHVPSSSTFTVWHTARASKNFRTSALWGPLPSLITWTARSTAGAGKPARGSGRKGPYATVPTQQNAKRISLAVKVPVLSLNTKSTCPSSSTIEVFLAFAYASVSLSHIWSSISICRPIIRWRTSKAMYSVIGSTGYNITRYFRNTWYSGSRSWACDSHLDASAKYTLTESRKERMQSTQLLRNRSNSEVLEGGGKELRRALVSSPT